jgi:hypothetical protein
MRSAKVDPVDSLFPGRAASVARPAPAPAPVPGSSRRVNMENW